jgi:VWFA-related protein
MLMARWSIALAVAVLAGVSALAGPDPRAPLAGQATVRKVYVSVTDGKGASIPDLTPADFTVKEDGKVREVTKVEPASSPLQIALLVDDNGLGVNDMRNGTAGFIQRMQGRAAIALVTTAGQNVVRVDYTTNTAALMGGVSQLFSRTAPPGAHLLEAIYEAAKTLQTREAQRSAIVVVTFLGEEYSNLRQDRVLDQLRKSGASLHVIAIGKNEVRAMGTAPSSAAESQTENLNRGKVLGDGPKQSGGRSEEMVTSAGVPKVLQLIADELLNQTLVTYALPAGVKPSDKISVSINRRGASLRAPTRVPDGQ